MTTPTTMEYHKPADWQHFERLCTAIFSELYSTNFQPHGRSGQRQNGVDSFGLVERKNVCALQCKGRSSSIGRPLTTAQIDDAVKEADTFSRTISEFFVLTTAPDDYKIQNHVLALNEQRIEAGKFPVSVWGWQTISEKIALCPRVQRNFYGVFWKRQSFLHSAGVVLVTAAAVAAVSILVPHVRDKITANDGVRRNSIEGLSKLSGTVAELEQAYGNCLTAFNKTTFMFTPQMRKECTSVVQPKLEAMVQMRDKFASSMDEKSYGEVSTLIQIMQEDFRQLLGTQEMTRFFENEYVRRLSELCYEKGKKPGVENLFAAVPKDGEYALNSQMQTYFVMRDFIEPGLTSIKARLSILSRTISDQSIPDELVVQANSLNTVLAERRAYAYQPTPNPLSTSEMKAYDSRNIKESGSKAHDEKEQMLWRDVTMRAFTESLRGRKDDVEHLISCHVLNGNARTLYEPNGQNG